jgi:hypothetical protein
MESHSQLSELVKKMFGLPIPSDLTNRWSQPLAVAMRTFDFMKQFLVFATLAAASGGSALSR